MTVSDAATWAPQRTILEAAQLVPPEESVSLLPGGEWFHAEKPGDVFEYQIPKGSLAKARFLTADWLVESIDCSVWIVKLHEAESKNVFQMIFGFINYCGARVRIPLTATLQNRWMFAREGAWIKPLAGGQRVDVAKVDRITVRLERIGRRPIRWCMTPLLAMLDEPPSMTDPLLPKGPLIDQLGQSTVHEWPAKTRSIDEVVNRLREQSSSAINQKWPAEFSKYGGYTQKQEKATGFFHTHHDGKRWWLVDPEGYFFWSAGMDCVGPGAQATYEGMSKALAWLPDRHGQFAGAFARTHDKEMFNFYMANFIRAFGPETWREHWRKIALSHLKSFGTNTVANWSDWQMARAARFPYVRPLSVQFPTTPMVYRDFPDVFHPNFINDCTAYGEQLKETLGDPALIGYFLMNEPTWGFSSETPGVGMIYNAPADCHMRKALAEFLRRRHGTDAKLSAAWGVETTYISIAFNEWKAPLNDTARADLEAFSTVMAEKLFKTLTDACKKVDPDHLNLGARYHTVPPAWALEGMKCFDVFSVNCYRDRIPREEYDKVSELMGAPVMVGEWHFGALDAGLPCSGIGHVRSQKARGQAYRYYLEYAADTKSCVGAHWFQMYDQSALGRFDGENYNIGFVDTCNRPYEELVWAARESHERMYKVALGEVAAFSEAPEFLPKLFI